MLVCRSCGNTEEFIRKSYTMIEVKVDGTDFFNPHDWKYADIGEDLEREYECCYCGSDSVEWDRRY